MTENIKRGRGRPRKEESRAVDRPKRVPVDDYSGPLHIHNPNPDYRYYWFLDSAIDGFKLFNAQRKGWEFVTTDDGLAISQSFVYKTDNVGSVYRVPGNMKTGEYQYLMKMHVDLYEQYKDLKQAKIDRKEDGMFRADEKEGQYGKARYESE